MIFTPILSKQFLRKISLPLIAYFIFAITILPLCSKLNESINPIDLNSPNDNSLLSRTEYIISPELIDRNFEKLVSNEKAFQNQHNNYLNQHFYNNILIVSSKLFIAATKTYQIPNATSQRNPRSPPLFLM